jgi:hypothetical protein
MGWRRTSGGVVSYGPFPGRLVMLDLTGPPEDRMGYVTQGLYKTFYEDTVSNIRSWLDTQHQ